MNTKNSVIPKKKYSYIFTNLYSYFHENIVIFSHRYSVKLINENDPYVRYGYLEVKEH